MWAAGQLRAQMQRNQQKFLRSVLSEQTQLIPIMQEVWLRLWRNWYHLSPELSEACPATLMDDIFRMQLDQEAQQSLGSRMNT